MSLPSDRKEPKECPNLWDLKCILRNNGFYYQVTLELNIFFNCNCHLSQKILFRESFLTSQYGGAPRCLFLPSPVQHRGFLLTWLDACLLTLSTLPEITRTWYKILIQFQGQEESLFPSLLAYWWLTFLNLIIYLRQS